MAYYPRTIESELLRAAKQFRVLVLTGARQTGKSTLLKHLFAGSHRYVTLDDPKNLKLAVDDPELFFQKYSGRLIIDEIQYAPKLLSYIKMIVDEKSDKGHFIITGSQQFTLIKGLRETLAGRAVLFNLLPMAIDEGPAKSRDYIVRSLSGSYPELIAARIDADKWFGSYINTYIEKDVQSAYRLEKITHFKDLLFLLAARAAQILNYQSLASDLGVSPVVVKSWIKILEASGIIYLLKPYYTNLGSRVVKAPKIYFTDVGLVSYMTAIKDPQVLKEGVQAGAIFENFVVQELLKVYANQGKQPPIYYYRTNNGLEVDIVIERGQGVLTPCEIKLSKTPHPAMANSMVRLRELVRNKKTKVTNGFIISLAKEAFPLTVRDTVIPLSDFLEKLK